MQPVRGTHDLMGEDFLKHKAVCNTAYDIAKRYGFEAIDTPIFEFTPVFHSLGETSDIVTKETYTFEDRSGQSVTLRPEGTAGVARAVVSNGLAQHTPLKLFYEGPMFRYERPQKGRYRQFHQVGVELIGVEKAQADVEVLSLAHQFLTDLDLEGSLALQINTLGDQESRDQYREQLTAFLEPYKNDLSEESQERLIRNPLRILDTKNENDQKILLDAPDYKDALTDASKAFFEDVLKGLEALDIPYEINTRLVRGLDYYCHTAFEFVTDALGAQGTVLAGGRYDGLVKRFGGSDLPGVGWAAGVERLKLLSQKQVSKDRPVVLIPLGEAAEQKALQLSQSLRLSGHVVELGYSGNLGKRMKRANKVNARYALIFGEDELKSGSYTFKDLDSGDQKTIAESDILKLLV